MEVLTWAKDKMESSRTDKGVTVVRVKLVVGGMVAINRAELGQRLPWIS